MRGSRNQRAVASNILEAIAQLSGGDAAEDRRPPTRMKIVVKKEDLKQVLEVIRDGGRRGPALEQRLNVIGRRQLLRAASQVRGISRLGSWRPVLQTIPEEL